VSRNGFYLLLVVAACALLIVPIVACASPLPVPAVPPSPPAETSSDNVAESGLAAKVPRISMEELRQKMDSGADILLVDTRKAEEYAKDRIRGAVSAPLDVVVAGQWVPARDKDIILY
jgi:hypothetical protein